MSSFLFAELKNNSFTVKIKGNLLGYSFDNIKAKIDTGCSYTTFPLSRLYLFDDLEIKDFKYDDILNNVPSMLSYGVESGGLNHKKPITFEEKMDCPALKFKHTITNFNLAGYNMPDLDIHINYDRHGNILIGMDILSLFDIHMGISSKTNKVTLIGVLKSQENKTDYEKALLEHFDIASKHSLMAEGIRSLYNKDTKIS